MSKYVFVLAVCMWTSLAFAGGEEVGNGGDVVYWTVTTDTKLLDFVEATYNRGWTPQMQPVSSLLAKLAAIHPEKAAAISTYYNCFAAESYIADDVVLTDISDSQHVALPTGTMILQAAIQHTPSGPGDPRYNISKGIWDRLDPLNKQGLITHEVIYRSAIEEYGRNSIGTRYLNALLYSKPLSYIRAFSDRDRYQISRAVGWKTFMAKSFIFEAPSESTFHVDGSLRCGRLPKDTSINLGGVHNASRVKFNQTYSNLCFHSSGNISFVNQIDPIELPMPGNGTIRFGGYRNSFYPNGQIEYGNLEPARCLNKKDGSSLCCASYSASYVHFDTDGYPLTCEQDFLSPL